MKKIKLLMIAVAIIASSCSSEDDDISKMISGEGIFTTQSGNSTIEGEFFLPEGDGPFPALIIVQGSGNESRESLNPFVSIINSFGYGLYIYDNRGIGGSTGSYPIETIENPFDFLSARAQDVIGIVNLLKNHSDVKTDEIGLFGASQGTWVNTIVYDKIKSDIGLMLMSSGGATSTGAENYYESLIESSNLSIEDANLMLQNYSGDLGYDPRPTLENTDVPTLFIFGGKDDSHPTLFDREIVNNMQKSNFTIHFYDNADHDLMDINTQMVPEQLFSEIGNWLSLQK